MISEEACENEEKAANNFAFENIWKYTKTESC